MNETAPIQARWECWHCVSRPVDDPGRVTHVCKLNYMTCYVQLALEPLPEDPYVQLSALRWRLGMAETQARWTFAAAGREADPAEARLLREDGERWTFEAKTIRGLLADLERRLGIAPTTRAPRAPRTPSRHDGRRAGRSTSRPISASLFTVVTSPTPTPNDDGDALDFIAWFLVEAWLRRRRMGPSTTDEDGRVS